MSHEISIREDGTAEAMYAVEPAWHVLGTVIDHAPNSQEAFKKAQLDWDVETRPLFYQGIADDGSTTYNPVPNRLATIRADSGLVLGVVSNVYKIVQNWEAFQFVDKLVGTGEVKYESAGALKGGRIIWLLARLPERSDFVADGDQLARYLLMYNSHDGSNSITIRPTSVRVVCWNTLSLADPSIRAEASDDREATQAIASTRSKSGVIRITHSQNLKFKMDDARKILARMNGDFDAFAEEARQLAQVRITSTQFESFLDRLVPVPETGKITPSRKKTRARLRELYVRGTGQERVSGTAWAALNAVTEFIDHDWQSRAKDPSVRKANTLFSTWFGNAGGFKDEARRAVNEMFVNA